MTKESDITSKLEELREKEAEDLAKILAQRHGVPYIDLSRITIELDALKIIPEKDARAGRMTSFQKVGPRLQIAVLNPDQQKTKDVLADLKRKNYKPEIFLTSENGLNRAWSRYPEIPSFEELESGLIDISYKRVKGFQEAVKTINDLQRVLKPYTETQENRKISETVEVILAGALSLGASDVHLEPQEKQTEMRFRLDGVLHNIAALKNNAYKLLTSRIKLVSNMKLNIHDRAQDGRFTIRSETTDIEVRVSSLPGPYGETLVLRVLNPKSISLSLEDLGMHPEFKKIIDHELIRPNGMIMTTGPTGSGKTTTLYAFVKTVNKPGINIITIEDPIEYHLKGISQTQVDAKKGYSFANGLRSILRQDPDVILVGEIRDLETAEIAMHAALTGHLVFSTLHTNDAAGTIPRLIDLKAEPAIIAPAVNIAMAQRLLRRLCKTCRKKVKPSKEEMKTIAESLKDVPKKFKTDIPPAKEMYIWKAAGCKECNRIGYKGRIGIYEALTIDSGVEKLILTRPSETEIKKEMKRQEMITMFQDGILKILNGITSLDELNRVGEED